MIETVYGTAIWRGFIVVLFIFFISISLLNINKRIIDMSRYFCWIEVVRRNNYVWLTGIWFVHIWHLFQFLFCFYSVEKRRNLYLFWYSVREIRDSNKQSIQTNGNNACVRGMVWLIGKQTEFGIASINSVDWWRLTDMTKYE